MVPRLDALVLADYFPLGVLTPRVRFLADSRERIAQFASMIINPNHLEAAQFFFPGQPAESLPLRQVQQAAQAQSARSGQPVYITLGERGCLLCEPQRSLLIP